MQIVSAHCLYSGLYPPPTFGPPLLILQVLKTQKHKVRDPFHHQRWPQALGASDNTQRESARKRKSPGANKLYKYVHTVGPQGIRLEGAGGCCVGWRYFWDQEQEWF